MTTALAALALLLHLLLAAAAALLLPGVARALAARFAGRAAPALLHPLRSLARLWRQTPVLPESASPLFRLAPALELAALLAAVALLPGFTRATLLAPHGALVAIVALLALARTLATLAALDPGTAADGTSAATTATRNLLVEPAALLLVFVLAQATGTANAAAAGAAIAEGAAGLAVLPLGLAALAIAWADTPLPPAAESSGPLRALATVAGFLRRLFWPMLLAALFLPWGTATAGSPPLDWALGALAWTAKVAALALLRPLADALLPPRLAPAASHRLAAAAALSLFALALAATGPRAVLGGGA